MSDFPNIKTPSTKYKSPDPSPVKPANMDCLITRYQKDISAQTFKIQQLKKALQKYDQNSSVRQPKRIEDKIRKLVMSNRQLLQQIKTRELQIQGKVQYESDKLAKQIAASDKGTRQYQIGLEQIREKHRVLQARQKEIKQLHWLSRQNKKLADNLSQYQQELEQYKKFCIHKDDFKMLQTQILELQGTEASLVSQNTQLTKELKKQHAQSQASSEIFESMSIANQDLNQVCYDLNTLSRLVKNFNEKKSVNIHQILQRPQEAPGAISTTIQKTKSELFGLKNMLSDIYAEYCGNACINQ